LIDHRRERTQAMGARLGDPRRFLETKIQNLDHVSHKLDGAFDKGIKLRETRVVRLGASLRHPRALIDRENQRLHDRAERLKNAGARLTIEKAQSLKSLTRMLDSLSFERVLDRGYVVVRDEASDKPITSPADVYAGQGLSLQFKGERRLKTTAS
jgi:exodeoxyribonuclease VII large subunit